MKLHVAITLLAAVAADPCFADGFGIDFSPLHAPGFGKRRDLGEARATSDNSSHRRESGLRESPEMKALGKELRQAQARLSRDVIPLPDSWRLPSGGFSYETLDTSVGTAIFGYGGHGVESFRVPLDRTAPIVVASQSLPAAAAIARAATRKDFSDADAAFLASQAALALEGAPLRVTLESPQVEAAPEAVARVRVAAADVEYALDIVRSAHEARLAAEKLAAKNDVPILETDPRIIAEGKAIDARYEEAIKAEYLANEKLRAAQTVLNDALKVIQGSVVIRD